jgi:hypothetical protein
VNVVKDFTVNGFVEVQLVRITVTKVQNFQVCKTILPSGSDACGVQGFYHQFDWIEGWNRDDLQFADPQRGKSSHLGENIALNQ